MQPSLVDLHCHLDLYPDHAAAIRECERDGICALTVTTTPKAWPRNRDLTSSSRHVHAALGLHPQLVAERSAEIGLWEEYLSEARYVGEVGLDGGPAFYRSLELQRQIFERVLRACARKGGKFITVHSVRSVKAVLDMIEKHLPRKSGGVVLHWFTGSKSEASRAVDLGCYFSVNSEMLRKGQHRDLVASLPSDRILTETDGPFTRTSEGPTRPSDVRAAIEAIAASRGADPQTVAVAVRANLINFLGDEAQSWAI